MEARPRLLVVVALLAATVSAAGAASFNAKNYGAKGNGVNDDTKVRACVRISWRFLSSSSLRAPALTGFMPRPAVVFVQPLMSAWKAACGSAGAVTLVVPPGTYYIGPVQFHGPCKASTLTFQLQASGSRSQ